MNHKRSKGQAGEAGPVQRPLRMASAAGLATRFARALDERDGVAGAHCIHERWMRGEFAAHIESALESLWKHAAASIPDWLALVGDSADGFPGLPGWGAKSASRVLARYQHLEEIPDDEESWEVEVRGAARLAATLASNRDLALLFRDLATLRTDAPVGAVDEWRWQGPSGDFPELARRLGLERTTDRLRRLADHTAR